ncbi:capsular biosynthesis protein [Pseudoxanthomonas broegbernensis]|uniref:protein-tyrosine-phosphatase n=1 Tax=Pseudoxanthomonas broegbernensis TaxID=83619 RepID=A0A7V8K7Y9_9GAMM|nr:CpsB/CapC family capsule biosynthesis tyrosine phosphatase [Pseudoxanthomonas broegbernensis]KAF1687175.1 capsular biosynthesis protein [Pseudoxanthomonas broegbernensis]MBB6065844.1 protein-tyrosine phosphatase [Pseudoxanthomonas broegbernensis]
MIDLHYHLLPGIDDGAKDLGMALEMARMSVADGVATVACTPHIYPGMYENTRAGILEAIEAFRRRLAEADVPLRLVEGADVHLVPGLLDGIRGGAVPTLAGSRYLLLEPSHHVAPPRFEQSVFEFMAAGLVPVITHPERLSWVEHDYDVFVRLSRRGAWMQITAGALAGRFGKRAQYWSERFLGEGHCMILATDAHDPRRRPPLLAEARDIARRLLGEEEARHLVVTRPQGIVDDLPPDALPPPLFGDPAFHPRAPGGEGFLGRLLRPFGAGARR